LNITVLYNFSMSKNPKFKQAPKNHQPVNVCDPESYDRMPLRIQFDLMDFDHEHWGWENLTQHQHISFLKFVHGLEKQTWAEIKLVAGGKTHGTNHHSIELYKFSKQAQHRLKFLNLETIIGDSLFSLRLSSIVRIYGARDKQYFKPIWHDPYHDNPVMAAYPLKK
jgi:hypothetical protein